MRVIKLTVAYDGTDFAGWQRQARHRTVQAVIEDALEPIAGRPVVIHGAGRTDAGVHAAGQVASLILERPIAPADLCRALNARLPDDVRVMAAEEAAPDFHARFMARLKTYHYRVCTLPVLPPLERRTAWHVRGPLDEAAMARAAAALVGEHDFASFQAAGSAVRSTVRTLTRSAVIAEATGLRYEVAGTGFLRYMVRAIVGTLVEVGRGRRAPDDLPAILAARDRASAGLTAPPQGLVLHGVEY
ncbi:MAG: tRNA pseudouridine(38-40) synthase TruA [Vicinamibacterales bacterium]